MRLKRPSGMLIHIDPDGPLVERHIPTYSCGHCQRTQAMDTTNPDMGGTCMICWSLLCGPCVGKGSCDPWEKQMERKEAEFESRRSMGLT